MPSEDRHETLRNESPFGFCLNTATIREQHLGIVDEIKLVAEIGYGGIEPWVRELDAYEQAGGRLSDLRQRIEDLGLHVPGAIAFFAWADADADKRRGELEKARREMAKVAAIGGKTIAAPPFGDCAGRTLDELAECYRDLLAVGREMGVTPAVEVWGHAKVLSRLCDAAYIVTAGNAPDACMVLDIYHLYKGGGGFDGIGLIAGSAIGVFHFNDSPAVPGRAEIADKDRVFPGDGVGPVRQVLTSLQAIGYRGMLSLELFNPEYYRRPAAEVAREGLAKMRAAVAAALHAQQ